jgi:hypothetical protein
MSKKAKPKAKKVLRARKPRVAGAPQVRVDPALDWHDRGCLKRYGAQPMGGESDDAPCVCELRRIAMGFPPLPGRAVAVTQDLLTAVPNPVNLTLIAAGEMLDAAGQDLSDDLSMACADFTVRTRRLITALRVAYNEKGQYSVGITLRRMGP